MPPAVTIGAGAAGSNKASSRHQKGWRGQRLAPAVSRFLSSQFLGIVVLTYTPWRALK